VEGAAIVNGETADVEAVSLLPLARSSREDSTAIGDSESDVESPSRLSQALACTVLLQ